MLNTADLHQLTRLADRQDWRLVLVGDPRELQAVGRGGMFDELCTAGRVVELERIHRFANQWEAAASLKLRHGDPRALDAYQAHGRIIPGSLVEHLETISDYWIEHHAQGHTTAITTTTNDHVDAINQHIQQRRVEDGDLDPAWSAPIADGSRPSLVTLSPPAATIGSCTPAAATVFATANCGQSPTSALAAI